MNLALKAGALALACLLTAGCSEYVRRAAGAAVNAAAGSLLAPKPAPRPKVERRAKTKKD